MLKIWIPKYGSMFVEDTPATHINFAQHLLGWLSRPNSASGATLSQICEVIK